MAKMNRLFFFMLFLLTTAVVAYPLEEEITEEIAPLAEDFALPPESDYIDIDEDYEDEVAIPPEPSWEQLEFLNQCVSKMTQECGKEVFTYMLLDLTVTKECCGVLVAMGELCHIGLVKTIFSIPEYKANSSLGIPRSKQVWNKCALAVGPNVASPIPFEN
ncbi:hypothetical protein CRYUN_Cryun26dG0099700 [Craigia yunnanensis]